MHSLRQVRTASVTTVLAAVGLLCAPGAATASSVAPDDESAGRTRWVSPTERDSAGNGTAETGAISADGRFGVYASTSDNVVDGDTNEVSDVFLRDMSTGKVTMISRARDGGPGNGASGEPEISADGRVVVFCSDASNLVRDDLNGFADIFRYKIASAHLTIATVAKDGGPTDGSSCDPSISADGRFVSFDSTASNLADGDPNDQNDIYVSNLRTGRNVLASHRRSGTAGDGESNDSSLSADGRFVSYHSSSSDIVERDRNDSLDVFVYDRKKDWNIRASSTPEGPAGDGASASSDVSDDGRFVVYESQASDLVKHDENNYTVDVFRTTIRTGHTVLVTLRPDGGPISARSTSASVNEDGRYVTFSSASSEHLEDVPITDSTIFVRDLKTKTTSLVSKYRAGEPTTEGCFDPNFSGRYITYTTFDRLDQSDKNDFLDVYRYELP